MKDLLMIHRMKYPMDLMMRLMIDSSLDKRLVSLIEHLMAYLKALSLDLLKIPQTTYLMDLTMDLMMASMIDWKLA